MKRITATLSAAALTLVLSACGAGDGQTPQTDPTLPGSGSGMDRDSTTPQSVPGDMNAPDAGSSFGDDQPGAGMDNPPQDGGTQP